MIIYFPHKLGQLKNGVEKTMGYLKDIIKNKYVSVKCNNSIEIVQLYGTLVLSQWERWQ